jgi:fructose 1,6-bisphosphate aldolase/phosphatase
MKLTLSVIKVHIGSIGGHICPSQCLLDSVAQHFLQYSKELLLDSYISHTGDDIGIVMTHSQGVNRDAVHELCRDAFMAGTEVVRQQGLYGAGQDLLKQSVLRQHT